MPRLIQQRQAVAARERDRAADVVAVLVGDEDRVEVARREPGAREAPVELAQREAAVDQDPASWSRAAAASTTVALPLLPLPRLQKRTAGVSAPRPTAGLRAAG